MPKFKNLESALKYIEKSKATTMKKMGRCIEEIMKEEIQTQVYDAYRPKEYERTGEFIDSVKTTDITKDSVQVTWRDNGNWYSVVKRYRNEYPDHKYVIHGHEMGAVWGRHNKPTRLVKESEMRVKEEIPDELIKSLRLKGINVTKK